MNYTAAFKRSITLLFITFSITCAIGGAQAASEQVQVAVLQPHSTSKINLAAQKLLKKKLGGTLRGSIKLHQKNIRLTERMIELRKPFPRNSNGLNNPALDYSVTSAVLRK